MPSTLNKLDVDQMLVTEKKSALSSADRKTDQRDFPETSNPWSKAAVAQLSPQEIFNMTSRDLEFVIRAAELPFLQRRCVEKLRYRNRDTLKRLVFLARRCCRNQGY